MEEEVLICSCIYFYVSCSFHRSDTKQECCRELLGIVSASKSNPVLSHTQFVLASMKESASSKVQNIRTSLYRTCFAFLRKNCPSSSLIRYKPDKPPPPQPPLDHMCFLGTSITRARVCVHNSSAVQLPPFFLRLSTPPPSPSCFSGGENRGWLVLAQVDDAKKLDRGERKEGL